MTAVPVIDPVCSLKRDKLMAPELCKKSKEKTLQTWCQSKGFAARNCSNELEDLENRHDHLNAMLATKSNNKYGLYYSSFTSNKMLSYRRETALQGAL